MIQHRLQVLSIVINFKSSFRIYLIIILKLITNWESRVPSPLRSIQFLSYLHKNLYLYDHVFSPLSLLFIINCNARLTPFPSSLNTTVDGLF